MAMKCFVRMFSLAVFCAGLANCGSGSPLVSAFKGRTGGTAIVVVNNGAAVKNQVFSVGSTMSTSVVPWVTSSAQNLQRQANVSVSSGSFTYTIPADSEVTFAAMSE